MGFSRHPSPGCSPRGAEQGHHMAPSCCPSPSTSSGSDSSLGDFLLLVRAAACRAWSELAAEDTGRSRAAPLSHSSSGCAWPQTRERQFAFGGGPARRSAGAGPGAGSGGQPPAPRLRGGKGSPGTWAPSVELRRGSQPSPWVARESWGLRSSEAAQGAPREPRRDSRGERSPWLPLETRPDSPGDDEDLREPLVRRQGSQVSMRVARGSASWLSPRRRLKGSPLFRPEGRDGP